VNSGTDGVGIDWANVGLTTIMLEAARIRIISNEKLLLKLPIINDA
jgi:hypothetical protein